MKREEALVRFREEETGYLEQIKTEFTSSLPDKVGEVAGCLQQVIAKLREDTERKKKEKIMFFNFSLLRIDFLNGTYQFLAHAMDARWYMDTDPAEAVFSLDFLFSVFDRAREKLLLDSRKYMGKVSRYDVEHILMETGMECNRILAGMLRFVFRDIEENHDFKEMPKQDTWGIRWGEYRDESELIACVDREKKEQKDWNRALKETKDYEGRMVSSFWYKAKLEGSDCSDAALCFIRFENCILRHMKFDGANLAGARFQNCTLESCSFQQANLQQADFEECQWSECDFQGADLGNCIFCEKEVPYLHLDAGQLQTILIDRRESV